MIIYLNVLYIGLSGYSAGYSYVQDNKFWFIVNCLTMLINMVCVWSKLNV